LVSEIEPQGPPALPSMERLVSDFINRGTEVSGRKQETLSEYWRWVVYTYGPSLLEALGTFRFLMTELVPLQLILETRGGLPSAEGGPGESGLGLADIPAASAIPDPRQQVLGLRQRIEELKKIAPPRVIPPGHSGTGPGGTGKEDIPF
jgi:hypothetical protein